MIGMIKSQLIPQYKIVKSWNEMFRATYYVVLRRTWVQDWRQVAEFSTVEEAKEWIVENETIYYVEKNSLKSIYNG